MLMPELSIPATLARRAVPIKAQIRTSAAALSMITKEKSPLRALFFRDHEISGLGPAAAPSPVSRPGAPVKDLSTSIP
jgi:hypothetical protein